MQESKRAHIQRGSGEQEEHPERWVKISIPFHHPHLQRTHPTPPQWEPTEICVFNLCFLAHESETLEFKKHSKGYRY